MPRRTPLSRTARALPGGALALLLLIGTACTSPSVREPEPAPVPTAVVPVPVPPSRDALVVSSCSALLRAVPEELADGLRRREVAFDPLRTAAWGEPAVTLECGVPRPERAEPPIEVGPNDTGPLVAFTSRDVGPATRFTTSGRSVDVAITVPGTYEAAQILAELTRPLRGLPTPSPSPSPSG